MRDTSIDGVKLKRLFAAGAARVSENIERINALNVFPVPDGDTGVNMHHTLRRAQDEIAALDTTEAGAVAERFAHGALMGARGNSGTILSQLLRGFAEGCAGQATLGTETVARGLERAVASAYAAVSQPVEGTILTVARAAMESARSGSLDDSSLDAMLARMVGGARRALNETPNLLPVLSEAGLVDAGGMGLLCFLEGMSAGGRGAEVGIGFSSAETAPRRQITTAHTDYGYDVQFLMLGAGLDIAEVRRELERLGDSVVVVGDGGAIKAHVHVANPALPLDYAVKSGAALDDIVIENMGLQAGEFQRRQSAASPELAVIAVARGAGIRALFAELGVAAVIDGGAGASPSTEDFLRALSDLSAERRIILPNDKDAIMPARQAAKLSPIGHTRVLPTASVVQGIAAMIAFGDARDDGADAVELEERMLAASADLRSIAIARASRSTRVSGLDIGEGDYIAIIDGEIAVVEADMEAVLVAALRRVAGADMELATLYYGAGESEERARRLTRRLASAMHQLEFELVFGGQDLYPYLISVE